MTYDPSAPFEITCPFPNCTITPLQQGSEEWRQARRKGISASDLPILMGVGYSTPYQLWLSKKEPTEDRPTRQMEYGLHMEELICDWATEDMMADRVRLVNWHLKSNYNPFFTATIDATAQMGKEIFPLEIKTVVYTDGADWEEGIPALYNIQIQWQLYVTGCPKGFIACLPGGNASKLIVREVFADAALQAELVKRATAFLHNMQADIAPEVVEKDLNSLPEPKENFDYNPDDDFCKLVEEMAVLQAEIKESTSGVSALEKKVKDLKAKMAAKMGEGSKALVNCGQGNFTITRKVINIKEKFVEASSYQKIDVKEIK
jgi:putative phage-type endonuclease